MGIFNGMMICTDLDGTLLKNDKTISDANKKAIEYFKSEGGIFTFITGRMPFFVSYITENVKPNGPFGCINGGGLYDYIKKQYIKTTSVPENVKTLIRYIDDNFPGVGIQVNTFNTVYFCKENETMKIFREATGLKNIVCPYEEVKEPIAKIIFGTEIEEEILSIEKMLKSHPMSREFNFIRSEKTLFEILPAGIGKGNAIANLCEFLNIDKSKTIAVGDYNNDISMFEAAGVGIAVANACEEAKKAADFITISNEEDAIAEIIYNMEKYQRK